MRRGKLQYQPPVTTVRYAARDPRASVNSICECTVHRRNGLKRPRYAEKKLNVHEAICTLTSTGLLQLSFHVRHCSHPTLLYM